MRRPPETRIKNTDRRKAGKQAFDVATWQNRAAKGKKRAAKEGCEPGKHKEGRTHRPDTKMDLAPGMGVAGTQDQRVYQDGERGFVSCGEERGASRPIASGGAAKIVRMGEGPF